jgi:type VI secretion system protein VasD
MTMWGIRATFVGLAAIVGAALAGCGGAPPPPPPTIAEITISAAADANPNAGGGGAPVAVRIYELTSTAAFEQADFFELYQREQEVLGADLAGRDEVVIPPGGTQQLRKELKPGVNYIGVVAAFRDIQSANWRATAAPPQNQTTAVQVSVEGLSVNVSMAPAGGGS